MAKTEATQAMNRCPEHGMYAAASTMVACPKCPREKLPLARAGAPPTRLAVCEAVIERGRRAFLEMGRALAEIRDERLYRERGYASFEVYCETQWGFSRGRAHQLIQGAEVSNLLTTVDRPANEAQARELVKVAKRVSPEAVEEVWKEAGPKPTAKTIRKAVQQRLGSGEVEQACTHPRHKCADCGKVLDAD